MANRTLLNLIENNTPTESWNSRCIALLNGSDFDWENGVVNSVGRIMTGLTNSSWGITVETCHEFCNHKSIPYSFNFKVFATAITTYLLPWVSLTAQLPFETGDFRTNFVSYCIAVGSPVLVTYSLAVTILNRYWVGQIFNNLRDRARPDGINLKYGEYGRRIRAAELLLQESQQVPLCISQADGWLSSLIVIPDNGEWWTHLKQQIKSTRKVVTLPLLAQGSLALIAYIFTVGSAFEADLGDPTTALQIASGSLWIWLLPVILGWIFVGTQNTHYSIEYALMDRCAHRALEQPRRDDDSIRYTEFSDQKGFYVERQRKIGSGDEQLKGPMYNYAKVFRFWQLASTVHMALSKTLDNLGQSRACRGIAQQGQEASTWDSNVPAKSNLTGTAADTATFCGLGAFNPKRYPQWSEIPTTVYYRMIWASAAGLFLQWGTTGASIMISYLTPTVGLGCRSGSYLLYGILATLVWLLLLTANGLSHEAMLRYQHAEDNQDSRSLSHNIICFGAELFKVCGYVVAILNTTWLGVSSLMELIGAYDNCWCKADVLGKGMKGWVVLFKEAEDLAVTAWVPWAGGLSMAISVCAISCAGFWVVTWKRAE